MEKVDPDVALTATPATPADKPTFAGQPAHLTSTMASVEGGTLSSLGTADFQEQTWPRDYYHLSNRGARHDDYRKKGTHAQRGDARMA